MYKRRYCTEESAKETLGKLHEVRKEGLKLNEEKTKILTQTRSRTPIYQNATANDYNF